MRIIALPILLILSGAIATGCQSNAQRLARTKAELPTDQLAPTAELLIFPGLGVPEPLEAVDAVVVPPAGWRPEPLKSSDKHDHQVWISPSGNTAYGIIRMKLPLPVGADLVLRQGFIPEMRRTEGEAKLLYSVRDRELPGLRFEVEGGKYHLRANLITRGWRAWAIYAGTIREHEVVPDELAVAELARDHTTVGMPRD